MNPTAKLWNQLRNSAVEQNDRRRQQETSFPSTELRRRLREAIESHIDRAAWDRLQLVEAAERETLAEVRTILPNMFRNRFSEENQSAREDDHAK